MALIATSLIWVAYAVCLAILFFIAGTFVFVYQKPHERGLVVTLVCFITVLSLLATVLLLPVDVALVSSTTNIKLGAKKDWATPDAVDNILFQLKVVYYSLYSLDAVLCLLVVPFTYFWYEEYDEVATEDGTQTFGSRLWGAFKYTIVFIAICVILFLVGFFIPVAKQARDDHRDLDYFKYLLTENRMYIDLSTDELGLTNHRWRACFDVCYRNLNYHRHCTVLLLHCAWSCLAASRAH
jgi:LMBR1 domain-containing protein 1